MGDAARADRRGILVGRMGESSSGMLRFQTFCHCFSSNCGRCGSLAARLLDSYLVLREVSEEARTRGRIEFDLVERGVSEFYGWNA